MLILCRRGGISFIRPKYIPRTQYEQWVVIDSSTQETIYGPETHLSCMNFIRSKDEPKTT